MAASAYNTTTVQYPIWINKDRIYCDEAKLLNHLTQKLRYNENDGVRIIQQINGHIEYGLDDFWDYAANNMSTEPIRILLHSLEHSQLIYMLSYQDEYGDSALYCCADNKNNEVIKVILDSVSDGECYQLLNITNRRGWAPLHMSCWKGDTESVAVMLNYIKQDMRYSLLQMRNEYGNTPLHLTLSDRCTDVMKVIHESVAHTQWINLLHMKDEYEMTALQNVAYDDEQCLIDTIRDSLSDEEWLQLVSTPLPEYNKSIQGSEYYQQAVSRIDELRAAARVKSALQTENNSGV